MQLLAKERRSVNRISWPILHVGNISGTFKLPNLKHFQITKRGGRMGRLCSLLPGRHENVGGNRETVAAKGKGP